MKLARALSAILAISLSPLLAVGQERPVAHGVISWGAGGPEHSVPVLESDLLWAARMLVGSQQGGAVAGGDVRTDARLWAAAQRHALQCDRDLRAGRRCRWRRFSDSFRAYSTAIAPQWSVRGWCAPGGLHAGSAMCSPERMRRRAWVTSRTWEQIADCCADLRGYLQAWARGERSNPVERATHTDQAVAAPARAVVVGSNGYWCERESCRWPANYVRLEAP